MITYPRTPFSLYGGAALALVLAAAGGFGLAKCTSTAPAPESEASEKIATSLDLTAEAITSAGVQVAPVTAGGLAAEVLATAVVAASPSGQAILTAPVSGAVTRIFKRLGDPVRARETLAVVESQDAARIAADQSAAAAKAALARQTLAREKSLYEQRVSPRMDYEQAQAEASAAEAEVRRARAAASVAHVSGDGRGILVISPINGRVTTSTVSLGAYVQPETELFRVADPSEVHVEAQIAAADASRIAAGDRAQIETADGRSIQASVRSVTPSLDPQTRAVTAVLDARDPSLRPGQSLQVRLFPTGSSAGAAIVVPDESVQSIEGRDVVFVRTASGFRVQPVTVTQRGGGRAEIAAGLNRGQLIATRNAFVLKAELGKGEGEEE